MKIKPRKKLLPIATAVFGKEEEKEIIDTLRSGWITLGPKTKKFEEDLQKYLGVKHAIALNSGSAALHLAMVAIGVKQGDEVILPTLTFAATANAVIHCGATPVFVDIDPKTFNIDPQKIAKAISKKTKAIIPVHYGGQPVDLDQIIKFCKKNNLFLIEDAAHAIGAKYKNKMIGSIGDVTCFSFHPVKNMTTGDGGAITTDNNSLADKIRILRVNGMDKESWKRNTTSGSWDYAISSFGFKYHMNDLAASLGIHQLKKLNKNNQARQKIVKTYDKFFSKTPEITVPFKMDNIIHANNLYPILIDTSNLKISRNQIIEELKKYNIGSVVYYRPLHLQPYFQKSLGYKQGDFPTAESVFEKLICLPLYHGMTTKDAEYVSNALISIIGEETKIYR